MLRLCIMCDAILLIVVVETLDYKRRAETPGIVDGLLKDKHSFTSISYAIQPRSISIDQENKNTYVIELKGPLLDNWKRQLEAAGVKLMSSVPYYNYTAKLTPIQANKIRALPFVDNLFLYNQSDTRVIQSSTATQPSTPETLEERKMTKYFAILHDEDDMDSTLGFLKANNVYINSAKGRIISFNQYKDSDALTKIKQLPEVAELHEFIQSQLDNDISRLLLGIDSANSSDLRPNFSQEGAILGISYDDLFSSLCNSKIGLGILAEVRKIPFSTMHTHSDFWQTMGEYVESRPTEKKKDFHTRINMQLLVSPKYRIYFSQPTRNQIS